MKNKLLFCVKDRNNYIQSYKEKLSEWFCSKEIRDLVEVFQGKFPLDLTETETLAWLVQFSDIWDYRQKQKNSFDSTTGERARWLIKDEGLSLEQTCCIDKVIGKLGLLGVEQPSLDKYDYILALGGARMSCLYRTKYAWDLAQKYGDALSGLVLLGAMRPIADTEREATNTYATSAYTEFDLMEAAIHHCDKNLKCVEKLLEENENVNLSWKINYYQNSVNKFPIISMAAASTEVNRRANSADSYQFFWEKIAKKKNSSVLLVTSQIYVPYQHIEAVRTLGLKHDINIDTVGFPTEWNVNNIGGMMQYENYLQEIRSALQAIERFWNGTEYRRI